tara:strand:+ start:521 stop:1036 length:516 start_codon:yes stop_codon:yes gene_type:complete
MDLVAEGYGIPLNPMRDGSRDQLSVSGRRVVAICLRIRGYSLPVIGRAIGCDHTTVMRMIELFPDPRGTSRRNHSLKTKIDLARKRAEEVLSALPIQPSVIPFQRRGVGKFSPPPEEPELPDDERESHDAMVARLAAVAVEKRHGIWQRYCEKTYPHSWERQAAMLPRLQA